jgi:hypothetical protein
VIKWLEEDAVKNVESFLGTWIQMINMVCGAAVLTQEPRYKIAEEDCI